MNPFTRALMRKAGQKVGHAVGQKAKGYLQYNAKLNKDAESAMNKKYPSGWGQSATNMAEFNQIKKQIKHGRK